MGGCLVEQSVGSGQGCTPHTDALFFGLTYDHKRFLNTKFKTTHLIFLAKTNGKFGSNVPHPCITNTCLATHNS